VPEPEEISAGLKEIDKDIQKHLHALVQNLLAEGAGPHGKDLARSYEEKVQGQPRVHC